IATIVLSGHEETVLLRPMEKLLTMTVLYYANQVKNPATFEAEIEEQEVSAQEQKLASTLVDASTTDHIDFSQYKDLYNDRVAKLIEAKLSGKKLEAPQKQKAPAVINLMDALRKSLDRTHPGGKLKGDHPAHARRPRAHAVG